MFRPPPGVISKIFQKSFDAIDLDDQKNCIQDRKGAVSTYQEKTLTPNQKLELKEFAACPLVSPANANEADLKAGLLERTRNGLDLRDEIQEWLHFLHCKMSATGRGSKFTPFLRDELGWSGKNPYKKAMRWIARYQFRAGLISKTELDSRQGNGKKRKSPLQPGAKGANELQGVRPTPPDMMQAFSIETHDIVSTEVAVTGYSRAEIAAHEFALEQQASQFVATVLYRAPMTVGLKKWFDHAWRRQMKLHRTSNFNDTMVRVFLCGTKSATPDDEWGRLQEEIFRSIGNNPNLASQPDTTDYDPDWDPNPNNEDEA